MPVVPFSQQSKPLQQPARIDIPEADAPWILMAAAQMDAQGRLVTEDNGSKVDPNG